MGGMFTILKMREDLASYDEDPGWYEHPAGTVALPVGTKQSLAPPAVDSGTPVATIAPATEFQAVRANSCASMAMGRR